MISAMQQTDDAQVEVERRVEAQTDVVEGHTQGVRNVLLDVEDKDAVVVQLVRRELRRLAVELVDVRERAAIARHVDAIDGEDAHGELGLARAVQHDDRVQLLGEGLPVL